jgi:hypothetical protein
MALITAVNFCAWIHNFNRNAVKLITTETFLADTKSLTCTGDYTGAVVTTGNILAWRRWLLTVFDGNTSKILWTITILADTKGVTGTADHTCAVTTGNVLAG